jgi:signal transduction histidine kinase
MKATSDFIKSSVKSGYIHTLKYDWENIFNSMTDMVTIHDKDFNIICANNAAEKNLKLPSLTGKEVKCFSYYHGTTCPPEGCSSCKCLRTGIPDTYEMFEPHLNKYIEIRAIPRFDSQHRIIGIIHIVRDITSRKQREKKVTDARQKLRNLTAHLLTVREKEREHISREIHDELAQLLTALKMELALMKKKVPGNQKSIHRTIRSMSNMLDNTIHTVQSISSELRPKLLDELGLKEAMKWQARKFRNHTGITCRLLYNFADTTLDKNINTTLFRILQESLTNVFRHAKASKVQVSLTENAGCLLMEVKDDGRGITKAEIDSPKSLGLIGMRERIYCLRGRIDINRTQNKKGTRVLISIPLKKSCSKNYRKKYEREC